MEKKVYTGFVLEIQEFSHSDIITASEEVTTRDPDKPIELPFVPRV